MNAPPGPTVSGKYFFPKAPLWWVKRIPACAVTSRKVICARAEIAESVTATTNPRIKFAFDRQRPVSGHGFSRADPHVLVIVAAVVANATTAAGFSPATFPARLKSCPD